MTLAEIIAECRARATQSVLFAGMALGDLKRGASYLAAKEKTLGVDTFWSGGKLRTASIDILRRLGVEDAVAPAKDDQPEASLLTPQQPVPALPRKAPAPKAVASRRTPVRESAATRQGRRRDRLPETVD